MKKSRLLEIIREEIAGALREETNVTTTNAKGENEIYPYNTPADKLEIARLKKDSNIKSIKTTGGQKIKEGDQSNILVPSNLIRSYITELIYSAEDMEYTPEMVKKLKVLKGGLSGGKISVEDALDIVQQTIDITEDEIDAVEALGQAVDYDDTIVNAARDIKGLNEDQLNEMAFTLKKGISPSEKIEPRYSKEKFKKAVDLILSKVDGKKTMADVARELGVSQQTIRPTVSDLIATGILEKGEAESKSGKDVANKPGPKTDPNKPKAEPKTPGVRGRKPMDSKPKASTTDMDDEAPSGDEGVEKAARNRDELVKQYRNVMSTYKEMKAEKGDQAAMEYIKTKQNIVKKYKAAQQVK
jgi:transposase-like protein